MLTALDLKEPSMFFLDFVSLHHKVSLCFPMYTLVCIVCIRVHLIEVCASACLHKQALARGMCVSMHVYICVRICVCVSGHVHLLPPA